jgi:multimeric flavodoxin WrbA
MRIIVLAASPRVDGNSRLMADALLDGASSARHDAELVDLSRTMDGGFLRDCRRCRRPDGTCSIEDGYAELLTEKVAEADGLVYATPLYWYGIAAVLKNFFDRMICYLSASYPASKELAVAIAGKRTALLLSSEERYPGAALGVVAQLQEMSRYLGHEFVAVINGVGNTRGEVAFDPADPLDAARSLGSSLFDLHYSDYSMDAERPNSVWSPARTSRRDAAVSVYDDV